MTGAAEWNALLQACAAVFTWMIRVADAEGTRAHDAYHRFLEVHGIQDARDERLASLAVGVDIPRQRRVEAWIIAVRLRRRPRLELRLQPDVGPQEEPLVLVLVRSWGLGLQLLPDLQDAGFARLRPSFGNSDLLATA